jgi:hypothetical protein
LHRFANHLLKYVLFDSIVQRHFILHGDADCRRDGVWPTRLRRIRTDLRWRPYVLSEPNVPDWSGSLRAKLHLEQRLLRD